jgi:glycosyltransferase involved in cell wall biosynthesis
MNAQVMHRSSKRICIVTSSHIAVNPRVVKEADALHDAGYDVHVVFVQRHAGTVRDHDERVLNGKMWRSCAVRCARATEKMRWLRAVGRERFFRHVPRLFWRYGLVAERAEGRAVIELAAAASEQRADLFIGHNPEGLAAAAIAAKRMNASLGFDAEDFHTGETNNPEQIARVDFIQQRYLPKCRHLTAASVGIGAALAERYDVRRPVAVNNTFNWSDRKSLDGRRVDRRGAALSLYWYSQKIGLDRGIQDAIRAAGLLDEKPQIHLRGLVDDDVRASLVELARSSNLAELHFHPPVPPNDLLSRAVEHDVGLALEQGQVLNRAICTTNKLFLYLLAGLAVAATSVPGQASVISEFPGCATQYTPGDYHALARILAAWTRDRTTLEAAKAAALDAARERFNWELESKRLVDAVSVALGLPKESSLSHVDSARTRVAS